MAARLRLADLLGGLSVVFRIEGGQIAELWQLTDQLGLMQQRGAIPAAAGAEA